MTTPNLALQPNVMLLPDEDHLQLRYLPGDFAMQVYRTTLLARPGLVEQYLTGRQRMEYQQYLVCARCGRPCAGRCSLATGVSQGVSVARRAPVVRARSIQVTASRERHWNAHVVLASDTARVRANEEREVLLTGEVVRVESDYAEPTVVLDNQELTVSLIFAETVERMVGSPPPWFGRGDWVAVRGRLVSQGREVHIRVAIPEQVFVTTKERAVDRAQRNAG